MNIRRYLWLLLLIPVSGVVLFANIGANDSKDAEEEYAPVVKSHIAWMDLHLGSIYFDNMTVEEKEADVARFFVDGEVRTQDWVQSAKLFRACFLLALMLPSPSESRDELLKVALKGAKRCLNQRSDTMVLALAPCKMKIPDKWFCRELLEMYLDKGLQFAHEAVRAYCASLLHEALGEKKEARSAMEEAYRLAPDDGIIAYKIKGMRKDGGDFSEALDAIAQSESGGRPDSLL
ncbi:hypothetical protein J7M28_12475 [bacterium]|nr:hypothetical protein [bacterium]